MAPRRKPVELVPDEPQEDVEEAPLYDLETLDADTMSRLNVMGNAMKLAAVQIEAKAPEWAKLITDILDTIGQAVQDHKA